MGYQYTRKSNPLILKEILDPSNLADTGKVYSNDILGRTELMYLDDTNTEIQITSAGGIKTIQDIGATSTPTFVRLTLTQATGTAPLTISSTTVVVNLNSDLLDGRDETAFALLAGRSSGQTLIGGTTVGAFLALQSTSGVGTTDHIKFLLGNNGATEAMRITDQNGGRLGFGTSTPGHKIEIASNEDGVVNANVASLVYTNTANVGGLFFAGHARGTIAIPAALGVGDLVGSFEFLLRSAEGWHGSIAGMQAFTTEIPATGKGCYLTFMTTLTGTAIGVERVRIDHNGNSGFGTITPGARVEIVPLANDEAIIISGYSLTGSNAQSMADLAGTWNTTGIPTAIKLTITDTASNAASLLMDLIVGATSQFTVTKAGNVGLGQTSFGASATKTFAVGTGVAPTTSPVDAFQMYSADIAAGNASAYFRTELGDIVKLFKGAAVADAASGVVIDAEARTAINTLLARMRVTGGNGFIAD